MDDSNEADELMDHATYRETVETPLLDSQEEFLRDLIDNDSHSVESAVNELLTEEPVGNNVARAALVYSDQTAGTQGWVQRMQHNVYRGDDLQGLAGDVGYEMYLSDRADYLENYVKNETDIGAEVNSDMGM